MARHSAPPWEVLKQFTCIFCKFYILFSGICCINLWCWDFAWRKCRYYTPHLPATQIKLTKKQWTVCTISLSIFLRIVVGKVPPRWWILYMSGGVGASTGLFIGSPLYLWFWNGAGTPDLWGCLRPFSVSSTGSHFQRSPGRSGGSHGTDASRSGVARYAPPCRTGVPTRRVSCSLGGVEQGVWECERAKHQGFVNPNYTAFARDQEPL